MLQLQQSQKEALIRHARAEAPLEACGLLAGHGTTVLRVYPMKNIEQSETAYRLKAEEQYRVFMEIEENGQELLGIYHSHPKSPAYPSPRDIETAYYPEVAYVIVSLYNNDTPDIRAFHIQDSEITEAEILWISANTP